MNYSKYFFGLIFMSQVALALEGSSSGGGGNAVVCYSSSGEIESVELFDYWEQPRILKTDLKLDLGPESLTVEEKIELALKRIEIWDPDLAQGYRVNAQEILAEISSFKIDDIKLIAPNDDHSPLVPSAPCQKESFVIQKKFRKKGIQRPFLVRPDLYHHPKTSNTTKAGIILHETFYEEFLKNDLHNSDGIRLFNFFVSADGFKNFQDYFNVKTYVGIKQGTAQRYLEIFFPDGPRAIYATDANDCITLLTPFKYKDENINFSFHQGDCLYRNASGDFEGAWSKQVLGVVKIENQSYQVQGYYQKNKVKKYWIIDPLVLGKKSFKAKLLTEDKFLFSWTGNYSSWADFDRYLVKQGQFETKNVQAEILPRTDIEYSKEAIRLEIKGKINLANEQIAFNGYATLDLNEELKTLQFKEKILVKMNDEVFSTQFLSYESDGIYASKAVTFDLPSKKVLGINYRIQGTSESASAFCREQGMELSSFDTESSTLTYSYQKRMPVIYPWKLSSVECLKKIKVESL
ncbi:MAG: hypothetical protein AB7I27_09465 [Bacteriovoracaceae bacterium]